MDIEQIIALLEDLDTLVREERARRGVTLSTVAQEARVPRTTVHQVEHSSRSRMRVDTAVALLRWLAESMEKEEGEGWEREERVE